MRGRVGVAATSWGGSSVAAVMTTVDGGKVRWEVAVTEFDLVVVAAAAEAELRAAGTPERAEHEKAYLKSAVEHAGTPVPVIRQLAKRIRREHGGLDAAVTFTLATELWARPLHERRVLAVVLLGSGADTMVPSDLIRLEPLLRDSRTWALVDGLAGDVAATIVLHHATDSTVDEVLRRWGCDDDFWVRRASLLAHLKSLGSKGDFEGWERFCGLADAMLDEREFFVRKAIGWVLREAGKHRPEAVVDFVAPRVSRISGVTIREAVRYLGPVDRDALMSAYRNR